MVGSKRCEAELGLVEEPADSPGSGGRTGLAYGGVAGDDDHVAAAASQNPSPAARALPAQLSYRHEAKPAEVRPAAPPGPAPRPLQPVPG